MSISYKEKIISFIVLLLDGVIVYLIPSYFNNLNILYPMLTISLIPYLLNNNIKDFYKFSFILGIIYDLLYSNIFLFNAFLFLLLSKIDVKILKYLKNNLLTYLFLIIINIIIYDLILFILVYITNYQTITLMDYLYKIENSIILNIIFGIFYYFILKKLNDVN